MMLILMLIMMLKFCVKESSNLIGLENRGAAGFSIRAGLGWCSPWGRKTFKYILVQINSAKDSERFFILNQFILS